MDQIEMLVAASVRELAVKLRDLDIKKALKVAGFHGATQQSRDKGEAFVIGWLEHNPISLYVSEAHRQIRDVALQIQSLA